MRGEMLLLITLSGVWSLSSCEVLRKFHYVTEKKSWADAQSYCRNNYHDLASLLTMEDISSLLKNPQLHMDRLNAGWAWIGLYDDKGNWTWSLNGAEHHRDTHYTNWGAGQPNTYRGDQICTVINPSGYWYDDGCVRSARSVCYDGSAYVLQNTLRSWSDAQKYCRDQNMDLASVMDETEAREIAKVHDGGPWPWIGLYRKPWAYWSDQKSVSFTHWASGQPDNKAENCVSISTSAGDWHSGWCASKIPFVCQENLIPPQHKARLTVKISSDGADVNDPQVQHQLLEQVHAGLKQQQGISTSNLQWTQRDGSIFHKETNKKT